MADRPTARRGRRSRRRAARSRAPRTTACIAARTSSEVSPARSSWISARGDAHRRVGGLLGAADALELRRRSSRRRRSTNALGVDVSSMPPARRWSADEERELGRDAGALDAELAARRAAPISASIVQPVAAAASSSSRPSVGGSRISMPCGVDLVARRARRPSPRGGRRAPGTGTGRRSRRDLVEQVGASSGRAVDQDGDADHLQPRQRPSGHVADVVAVVEDRVEVELHAFSRSSSVAQRRPRVPRLLGRGAGRSGTRRRAASRTRRARAAPAGRTARRDVISRFARIRSACTVMPRTTRSGECLHVVEQDRRVGQRSIRSAPECEMSRSCQSATFSTPACALPRSTRARPQMRSRDDRVALVRHRARALLARPERLLDLAHLGALEVADLGREALQPGAGQRDRAAAARRGGRAGRPGWRPARARSPSRSSTRASKSGPSVAYVPTAPEIAPPMICANARSSRSALRCASIAKPASLRPNDVGSACTPWVRPTHSVSACSRACSASARRERRARRRRAARPRARELQRQRGVDHVGGRQPVVDPAPGRARPTPPARRRRPPCRGR